MANKFKFNSDEEALIKSGQYNTYQLSEMLGSHYQTIRSAAVRLGVNLPRPDMRKFKPNDEYFQTWSIEMAYVLGLLAADGHVSHANNVVMLNLKESDRAVVEQVKSFLSYDGPIYRQKKENGEPQAVLTITSKIMATDLLALGLTPHKTYDLTWPGAVPDEYVSHFVRGYFDGDGCVHYNEEKNSFTCNIIGTHAFIKGLKSAYEVVRKQSEGHIQAKNVVSTLYYHGKYATRSFLDWIYKDSTPETRLQRKYDIYRKFLDDKGDAAKVPNNSHIDFDIAKKLREQHLKGRTVEAIAEENNLSIALVHDVVANRSWTDSSYNPIRKKGGTLVFEHDGRSGTLTQWAEWTGVPKPTIDRRLREGKTFEQAIQTEHMPKVRSKATVGRAGMTPERAREIRQAYKNGIRGKAAQDQFEITKSQYIDLIANRVWKEDDAWWK